MTTGKLIIFSAPSGSGKTTIVRHLLKQNFNLEFSVSATSRKPRCTEVNGIDYYFITGEEFKKKLEAGEFLEWQEVYPGTCYGTLKSEIDRICNNGKNVIFDIDVVGGTNIKNFYGDKALAVFVKPPSVEELKTRLRARSTDSDEVIQKRLKKASYELTFASHFDVILVNDNLADTLANAEKIVGNFLLSEETD